MNNKNKWRTIGSTVIVATICCILLIASSSNILQRKPNVSALQEKLQDQLELLNIEKELNSRNKWMYNNICLFDYNTNTLRTLASSDGEIQLKIEPLPEIYLEFDNLSVEINHSLVTSFTKEELIINQIDNYTWRFNVSVDDSTEHKFVFNNGTQSEYVLYVTKELEPLNSCYFMPVQWQFIVKIESEK